MQSTVSERGQTVIPRPIREELGITPRTRLQWKVKNGVIIVFPIPEDPIQAAMGILKDRGPSTAELLAEREAEREKE
jgi:AbrB family looped-hinge helix DNA binding protein